MQLLENKTIRALCWIDLMLVGPMAIPPIAYLIVTVFSHLDETLGLVSPLSQITDIGYLFMSVTGILATVWSIARLKEPTRLNIMLDTGARLAVAALLFWAWSQLGASMIFALFLATEIVGAILQLAILRGAPRP
ncbi:MAG: hypothetical protein ACPG06_05100 [Alphaproteobacteria bacterium]